MEITATELPDWVRYARPALYATVAFVGLVASLRGYRLFRTLFALLTAVAGAALGVEAARTFFPDQTGYAVGGLFLGLILGGVLAGFGFRLATATGAAIAAGAIAAVVIAQPVLILATAFIGSFMLVMATSYFFGGPDWLAWVFDPTAPFVFPTHDPVLLVVAILVGLVGAAFQNRLYRKKQAEG